MLPAVIVLGALAFLALSRKTPPPVGASQGASSAGIQDYTLQQAGEENTMDWHYMDQLSAERNIDAFLALIREAEANSEYDVIAGGDHFSDYSDHPFIIDAYRPKPAGTTASGAYQMVKGTWLAARNALELEDFSPHSQDLAARWIIEFKRKPAMAYVKAGKFDQAIAALRGEWQAFDLMVEGRYRKMTIGQARALYAENGGSFA